MHSTGGEEYCVVDPYCTQEQQHIIRREMNLSRVTNPIACTQRLCGNNPWVTARAEKQIRALALCQFNKLTAPSIQHYGSKRWWQERSNPRDDPLNTRDGFTPTQEFHEVGHIQICRRFKLLGHCRSVGRPKVSPGGIAFPQEET